MLVLLDTDICMRLINRRADFERVLRRVPGRSCGEICLSAITASELNYGAARSSTRKENMAALDEFLSRFEVLDYPVEAASSYGSVRAELERSGKPIGNNDLLIAAHALTVNANVATANIHEFARVRGLKVLDWLT